MTRQIRPVLIAQSQQEIRKEALNGNLSHLPAHAIADPEMRSSLRDNRAASGFDQDFSQTPVGSGAAMVGRDYGASSCPMSPRACPFGGACHTCPARVQTKLKVNQPGDKYEQEADRIAGLVMRMPISTEAEEKPRQPETGQMIRRRERSYKTPNPDPSIVRGVLNSPGEPLDASTRTHMESRFKCLTSKAHTGLIIPKAFDQYQVGLPSPRSGQETDRLANRTSRSDAVGDVRYLNAGFNLSSIRIHTDSQAVRSAQALNALAYTYDHHIVFGAGRFAPSTLPGQRLLAHELAHTLQTQTITGQPRIFRRVAGIDVAGILDYDRLARQIHDAIEGAFTDEEAVYAALQRLQREPAAINQLETVFSNRYGTSLEQEIRDDFSGSELEYALQLINRGTATGASTILAAPRSDAEFQGSARRIRDAVEGAGTDEEAIFAELTPLQRDHTLIRRLSSAYQNSYNEDLHQRIVDEMSGSELNYALYLLGEERMETTGINFAEATRLFNALSRSTFVASTGGREPVPFHYPPDGCYDRAHVMSNILTQMGYATEKVFAVSRTAMGTAGLRVPTEYAGDVPVGDQPAVRWWYHVAPIIRVRTNPNNRIVEMVIDPSMMDRPTSIDDWTSRMSSGTFTRLTLTQLEAELQVHPDYPLDRPITYTTGRHTYYPISAGDPVPAAERAESYHLASRTRITQYAALARVHELAAAIRRTLSQTPINVNDMVNAINAAQPVARQYLWALFPNLRQEIVNTLSPADLTRVEHAVSTP